MGVNLDTTHALSKSFTLDVDVPRYVAVVAGSDRGHVALPAGANAGAFKGFTQVAGVAGDDVAIHVAGGCALATAASAFADGDLLEIANNLGQLQKVTAPTLTQKDAALVIAANQGALSKTALAPIAVNVLVSGGGKPLGPYALLPKGTAPAVTATCALSADGTKINFLAADGVTSADVEYFIVPAPRNLVAQAMGGAANAGDVVPVLPLHATSQG